MKCYDKQKIIGLPPAFILWVCIHTSCYGVSVARGHLLVDSRVRDLRHITPHGDRCAEEVFNVTGAGNLTTRSVSDNLLIFNDFTQNINR